MSSRIALFLVLAALGCRNPTSSYRPTEDEDVLRVCGPFGRPAWTRKIDSTRWIARAGYVVEHSDARRSPLWVAEHLRPEALASVAGYVRPKWRADPELPPGARAEDADFRALGPAFDRGHLAPSADFSTRALRDATFFLSNAVPQLAASNRGIWRRLEARARAWVTVHDEAWVVTGAIWRGTSPGREIFSPPSHLFKVILARRGAAFEARAFLIGNDVPAAKNSSERVEALDDVMTSVDRVEAESGLDLFPALPDALEVRLEREMIFEGFEGK